MSETELSNLHPERALGKLIFLLNPCTKGAPTATIGHGLPDVPIDLDEVSVEIDDYEGHWSFKEHEHRVKRAVRIQYRYKGDQGIFFTEHLLIGFLGSGGGE